MTLDNTITSFMLKNNNLNIIVKLDNVDKVHCDGDLYLYVAHKLLHLVVAQALNS